MYNLIIQFQRIFLGDWCIKNKTKQKTNVQGKAGKMPLKMMNHTPGDTVEDFSD